MLLPFSPRFPRTSPSRQHLLDDTSLTGRTSLPAVHGTAMGSTVSVVVADFVIEDVESRALTSFPSPSLEDHTCCTLRADLQFTLEANFEGQLAFLDVLISRNLDGSIDTTVYRKPTHTNKYLDFSSHHPLAHKIAVVQTLYSRAQALTSSAVTRTQEQHTISKALAQNGYPATFIHRHSQPLHDPTSHSQPPMSLSQSQYHTSKAPRRPSDESCPPLALEPPSALSTPYANS